MPRKKVTLSVDGEKITIKDQKGSAEQAIEKLRDKKQKEQFRVNMRFLAVAAASVFSLVLYAGLTVEVAVSGSAGPVPVLVLAAVHALHFYFQYTLYGLRMPKSQMAPPQQRFYDDVARMINNVAVFSFFVVPVTFIAGIAVSIYCFMSGV